jgi:hypothetical protein
MEEIIKRLEIVTDKMHKLEIQLTRTEIIVKEYNGLKERQIEFSEDLAKMQQCMKDKEKNVRNYQWLIGIIVGILISLISKFL